MQSRFKIKKSGKCFLIGFSILSGFLCLYLYFSFYIFIKYTLADWTVSEANRDLCWYAHSKIVWHGIQAKQTESHSLSENCHEVEEDTLWAQGDRLKRQRWWMTPRKQCLGVTTGLMHIAIQTLWHHAQGLLGPDSAEVGSGRWFPSLTKKLSATGTWCNRKISVLQRSPAGHINHTSGHAPSPEVVGQHRTNAMAFL